LPTEAEWEYAYRAGSASAYYNGINDASNCSHCDNDTNLLQIGWYCGNSNKTQPVGQKTANPWGLYDMAGNVWEWCQDNTDGAPDAYGSSPVTDPLVTSGASRIVRGGSYLSTPYTTRAANRGYRSATATNDNVGFRCARTLLL
jgi:formylglycine-generating enzyme required for sulfatase activity